jgi:alkylation response protein AidB-like acyl-CoA dehydrogenase
MDFDLSKPQKLLRETARTTLSQSCPREHVRKLMAGDSAFDASLWQTICDQGWLAMHLPEASGGMDLGLVELAVVAEEMGRACMPGPYLASQWAATLLSQLGSSAQAAKYLEPLATSTGKATVALLEPDTSWEPGDVKLSLEGPAGARRLDGRKSFVLDATDADVILCAARSGNDLAIVAVSPKAAGLMLRARPGLDATRKLYDLEFKQVPVADADVLATGARAESALEHSMRVATLAVCAEMVGAMQVVREMAVNYTQSRQQFGKIIGSFQAVQHQCADMLLLGESARSATYYAAWAMTAGVPEAEKALAIAKAYCSEAGKEVCNRGVQVHGGIGFTWEHDLHLYFKRIKACELLFGDATHHREQIAQMLLAEV